MRALLPLVEPVLGPDARQIREALSQLQMAYARLAGAGGAAPPEGQPAPEAGEAAPEGEAATEGAQQAPQPEGPGRRSPAAASGCRGVTGQTASPPPSSIACPASEPAWRPSGRLLPLAHASACPRPDAHPNDIAEDFRLE